MFFNKSESSALNARFFNSRTRKILRSLNYNTIEVKSILQYESTPIYNFLEDKLICYDSRSKVHVVENLF